MKMIIAATCFFLLFTNSAPAQNIVGQKPERNVPIAVAAAFGEKFPSYEPVWFSNYQGRYNQKLVYEGRFIFDNRYSLAIYDGQGDLIAFAATIEHNEIPAKALKYMKENFPAFPISEALLVTSRKNDITYELGIWVDGEFIVKVFSESGDFIRSTRA